MPDEAREQRLRELFDAAMDLAADERARFVAAVDDEVLRERLAALVHQDANPTAAALQAPFFGASLGIEGYELLRVLGRGGMGVAVLALQREPVERLVAIKLLDERSGDPDAVARFHAEQLAMARMDHPGIARVLDGGHTSDGAPFLVMEFVRGEPITTYCDRRRLGLRERVALSMRVCDAVQHAHQKGVIHRDVKPTNVLVTEQDGRPQPKLIDFGLARATAGRLANLAPTQPGMVVGTLLYMSPEQADPAGQDVDTRTDVWSIGAVLHELLVGAPPVDLGEDEGAILRFRAALAEGRIPGLAATARAMDEATADERAALRSTTAATLRRVLTSDLSAVVGKALAHDRARRYGTAAELGSDLGRWLAGEPVLARAPTTAYVVARFVRRHRVAVTATITAAVLLTVSAAAAFQGMRTAERARDAEARANARLAATVSRQRAIREFEQFVQLYADPGLQSEAPSLRTLLQRAEPVVAERWRDRPVEESAVRAALGDAFLSLGEPAQAVTQLRAAWAVAQRLDDLDPVWATELLADLSRAERQLNEIAASRAHLGRLLALGAAATADDTPGFAQFLRRAAAAVEADEGAAATAALAAAVERFEPGSPHGQLLRVGGPVLFSAALLLQYEAAPGSDTLLQRVEQIARQTFSTSVEFAMILGRLAENRLRMGHDAAALALADEQLANLARFALDEHWLDAQAARIRGIALACTGRGAEAEIELLALRERMLPFAGTGNVQVRASVASLRELCARLEPRAALPEFVRESFARWLSSGAPWRPWWLVLDDDCATPAALEHALRLVEDRVAARQPDADGPAPALLDGLRGAIQLRLGRAAAARPHLEAAVSGTEAWPELLADLAVARHRTGDDDGAARALQTLREAADAAGATPRWQRAIARAAERR